MDTLNEIVYRTITVKPDINEINGYPQQDILDTLLSIAIILFIISVIVEKITQLIRRYSPIIKENSQLKKTIAASFWKNINSKKPRIDSSHEKIIEREINSLSFMIGLLIAILFRVDLFKMLSTEHDPRKVLFWNDDMDYSLINCILFPISIGLTAFFLTFGSKFFHDLIDTLFLVKNAKRKLADENTYNSDNIGDFDTFIQQNPSQLIEAAIEKHADQLVHDGITREAIPGRMKLNGELVDCISIHIKSADRGTIPEYIRYELTPTKKIQIPVNVVLNVSMPTIQVQQGEAVSEADSNFKGTICCLVEKDGVKGFLTCSHIYTNGKPVNPFGKIQPPVPARINGIKTGKFTWGLLTSRLDIAFVEASAPDFTYHIQPGQARELDAGDILNTPIRVVKRNTGSGSTIEEGVIISNRCKKPIKIGYGGIGHELEDLIELSKVNHDDDANRYTTLTKGGDSGSCVYDDQDRPIGMIVAGNEKFSYAISMKLILSNLNANIL